MRRRMTLAAIRSKTCNRAPLRPRWYWPVLYLSGIAGGLIMGLGTGAWLGWSGTVHAVTTDLTDRALELTGGAGLELRAVYADGREHTDRKTLKEQLGVRIGDPILGFDTAAAQARLEELPWIERASVGRFLPDTVKVRLVERKPLAIWQHGGAFALIDRDGGVIVDDVSAAEVRRHFDHLRVLVGEGAPDQAVALFKMLSVEPELSARVKAASWVGGRRWTLRLDNKVDVLLPEEAPLQAWRYLAKAVKEQALLERAVVTIDLRQVPDRMRLKLDPSISGNRQA
ncbi:MAG: FtsQ-type POTRA domain-containing protein [Alphaproteobacteria bacterium]|nr:FtsQ-type POTRA domain-containing protein [Alphaproteobacteria bacterium]